MHWMTAHRRDNTEMSVLQMAEVEAELMQIHGDIGDAEAEKSWECLRLCPHQQLCSKAISLTVGSLLCFSCLLCRQ